MCCRDRPGIKSHFVDTDCHLLRRGGWSGGAGGMKAREWARTVDARREAGDGWERREPGSALPFLRVQSLAPTPSLSLSHLSHLSHFSHLGTSSSPSFRPLFSSFRTTRLVHDYWFYAQERVSLYERKRGCSRTAIEAKLAPQQVVRIWHLGDPGPRVAARPYSHATRGRRQRRDSLPLQERLHDLPVLVSSRGFS